MYLDVSTYNCLNAFFLIFCYLRIIVQLKQLPSNIYLFFSIYQCFPRPEFQFRKSRILSLGELPRGIFRINDLPLNTTSFQIVFSGPSRLFFSDSLLCKLVSFFFSENSDMAWDPQKHEIVFVIIVSFQSYKYKYVYSSYYSQSFQSLFVVCRLVLERD